MNLATYFRRKNLYPEAVEELKKALKLDPNFGIAMNSLAYNYADMGDFDKAIESFKRYASFSPGDANPFDSMADLYFKMGRLEEAVAKYKEALEIKPDFGAERWITYIYAIKGDYSEAMKWVDKFIAVAPSPGLKAQGYLGGAFYRGFLGQVDQAIKDLQKAEELWQADGNLYGISVSSIVKGMIYYDIDEFKLSREYYKKYFDFNFEHQPQYSRKNKLDSFIIEGLIATNEGKVASAKLKLEEAKSLLPESSKEYPGWAAMQKFTCDLLHAEILLTENSVEKAIEVMENASPLEVPAMSPPSIVRLNIPLNQDVLARAYLKKGELDKAIAAYEDLIHFNPDSKDRRAVHPKYHYSIARLYEQKGWKGKAIEHYEKFLALWKDADPGIAEIEDARKRLAGLKRQ